ncbi:MAG TPA: Nramp family divalent metal transporter [Flavobacteriaceae bacterium]|nr:Nramp family divalent metal transporter [Flavobacteriaceae bacterium]
MGSDKKIIDAAAEVLSGKTKGIRRVFPFLGPAFIAAVAYIDPGNFATNIAAGSKFGYLLLWVIAISNLLAVLIQSLSAKLGIATGHNLPELSRKQFPKWVSVLLWVQGELVVMATDLAEFIGAALGIYLLFDLTLLPSAIIAVVGSYGILEMQRRGFRPFEAIITGLIFVVVIAFSIQVYFAEPELSSVLTGLFTPKFNGAESVLLATGILGATVMPHAIYLHSALTQNRVIGKSDQEKRNIFSFEFIDILIAMLIAGAINACMLIIAASLFFENGINDMGDLSIAYDQFYEMVGPFSAISFGVALLAAGLSSSSVGTKTGDVIMQGYIKRHIPIYLRRLVTIIPPLIIIAIGVNPSDALVISQVILSFGIPFALIPLIVLTSNKKVMGCLVNHSVTTIISWLVAGLIISLNFFLLYQLFTQ